MDNAYAEANQTCARPVNTACDPSVGGPGDGLACTYDEECDGSGGCTLGTEHTCGTTANAGHPFAEHPRCEPTCGDIDDWTVDDMANSCSNPYVVTRLDDNRNSIGDAEIVTGNCEDMAANGDHWYRIEARDAIDEDVDDSRDYFAPHFYFQRNDDSLFQFDIYSRPSTSINCGSLSSYGCGVTNATSTHDCTNITEYRADLRQNPCHEFAFPQAGNLRNYCQNDTTYYWIRVQKRGGFVCNGCEAYALAVSNGRQCYDTNDCPVGWFCQSSSSTANGGSATHPGRCVRADSTGQSEEIGDIVDGSPNTNPGPVLRSGNCDDISAGGHWYSFTAKDDQTLDAAQSADNWAVEIDFTLNDPVTPGAAPNYYPGNGIYGGHFQFKTYCETPGGGLPTHADQPIDGGGGASCTVRGGNPGAVRRYRRWPDNGSGTANDYCSSFGAPTGNHQHCADDTTLYWVNVIQTGTCDDCLNYTIALENDYQE